MAVFFAFGRGNSLFVFQTEYYLIQLMYYDKKIIDVHNFSWRLSWAAVAQNVALKTNLLYWSTVTPNLGLEASIARKHTVQLFTGSTRGEPSGGKSLKHWVVQPEYRYGFARLSTGGFSVCI